MTFVGTEHCALSRIGADVVFFGRTSSNRVKGCQTPSGGPSFLRRRETKSPAGPGLSVVTIARGRQR